MAALLQRLCPEGVEVRALGDVGEFVRGNGLQKSELTDAGVGAIHYGQIHSHYGIWADRTRSFVSEAKALKLRKAQTGDIVIATTSEDDADVAKAVAWVGNQEIAISGDACIYRHKLDPKYVAYFLSSDHFQEQKVRHVTGTKVRRISGSSLAKIRIPVPPLEVQREIVKVLDTFSKLENELENELEARRRQYRHYLDELLAFRGQSVRRAPLGDLGQFIRGRRFTKADYVDAGGVPCIHYGEIYTRYGTAASEAISQVRPDMAGSLRYALPGDVVITDVGETVVDVGKAVAWLGDDDVAIHDHCYAFRHSLNPKFVAYCMQTSSFVAEKAKYVARTKVNTLLIPGYAKITIPAPPPAEQDRIVAILDRFDALVNDLSSGLPAEIKARRQQYEHYRDRLLSFKEAA